MKEKPKFDEERAKRFVQQRPAGARNPAQANLARRITADWAPESDHYVCLDVGTGPGRLLVEVKTLFPRAKAIGIDSLEYMVEVARQNVTGAGFTDIEINHGRAEQIQLDSATVDLVVAQSSLLFWDDPKKGLSEVYRVLKSNGRLVIVDWNKSFPKWKFYLRNMNVLRREGWIRAKDIRASFRQANTFEKVLRLLRESNFEPVETEGQKELRFFIKAIKAK